VPAMDIRILLCHSHKLLHEGLRAILGLQAGMKVVGETDDGYEAVAAAGRLRPDVVLVGDLLPELSSMQVIQRIRSDAALARVRVVVLTEAGGSTVRWIRAGAQGVLLRSSDTAELVFAIRAVAAGGAFLAPPIAGRLLERFGGLLPGPEPRDAVESLTDREYEVFKLIANGLSNLEIAAALFVTEATVKYHLRHVLEKLNLRDRLQVAVFAHTTGLA
jgi:DNA-binding NarL/FixJ family response regulator